MQNQKRKNYSIPAMLSDDRKSVTLSDEFVWCYVRYGEKGGFFVREDRLKPEHNVVELEEGFGVLENVQTRMPVKCSLLKIVELIKRKRSNIKEKENEF